MSMPIVVLFGIFTLLCAWSLTSLLLFHGLIITLAQTTNERVRNVYQHTVNTDNHGCCANWAYALCSRRPSSLLPNDFSEMVTCGVCQESVWSPTTTSEMEDEQGETRSASPAGGNDDGQMMDPPLSPPESPAAMSDVAVNGNRDNNV
jgi:hypothetical protein